MNRKSTRRLNDDHTPAGRTYDVFKNNAQPLFNDIDLFLFNVEVSRERGTFTFLMNELPQVVRWLLELGSLGRNALYLAENPRLHAVHEPEGLYIIHKRARQYTARLKRLIRETARYFVIE